jgi:hypothetical protein
MPVRRINMFAGPGVGKSTAAAWLFARLSVAGIRSDLVQERVKEWAYEGRKVAGFDQLWLFAEQLRREELLLRCGVQVVVTDSPIRLSVVYSRVYGLQYGHKLSDLADMFDEEYEPLNVILKRPATETYDQAGRYETLEQAVRVDDVVRAVVQQDCAFGSWCEVEAYDWKALWAVVSEKVVVPYGARRIPETGL